MIAQKTYWIQTKMSRSFTTMDPEEYAALVSAMRNLARFCGINILTYQIEAGKLNMLVSCPAREHHLDFFEDGENEPSGSGEKRLLRHLRNLYSNSYLQELEADLELLREEGESVQPLLDHYTRRIGVPRRFAEGVSESFTRWIKRNRPQLFESLEGKVCRKGITQTVIDQLQKQREIAMRLDRDAVMHDDGREPRKYWCGYADALRGDEDALDGFRELLRSPANNAQDILKLGYCRKRIQPGGRRAELPTKSSKGVIKSAKRRFIRPDNRGAEPDALDTLDAPPVIESLRIPGQLIKISLIGFLIIISGVVAFVISEKRNKDQAIQIDAERNSKLEVVADSQQKTYKAKELALADVTSLLYKQEARQMAVDFAKSSDPEIRLKMCRDPENVRKRLNSYPAQAVNEIAKDVIFMDVVDLRVITAARFYVKFADDTKRLLCVVPTPDGLRVDWDCYARYNTEAWPKLLDGTVKSAEFRVFARRSDYHAFEYRDETQWICFELLSPDFDDILYAYAARGTTTAKLLEAAVPYTEDAKVVQLTLQLSSPGESHQHKQFTIDRLYATGWVRGETDIEDDYREKIHELGQINNK